MTGPGRPRPPGAAEQLELGFAGPEPAGPGATADRAAPDGVAPDGVAPDGVAPDGEVLDGTRPVAASARKGRRRGAVAIAAALGRPEPTPEQVAVIEAPIEPLLVVAGAGSGKTETMAARVVWLVANGQVRAEQVLGLTFTRKAAGELAERIRTRLRALHRHGLVDAEPEPVTVATYHSYAASVLGDHGLRLGIEPGTRLLGEAGAWQLAAELVAGWDGEMTGVDKSPTTVTEAVLALAGECAEHLVDPAAVDDVITEAIEQAQRLPAALGDPLPGSPKAAVRDRLALLAARRRLVPLVQAYLRRKRELEVLDFGDQVALAARLARDFPQVGAGERARYQVVLLDEYQDTSHAQLVLLRGLFGAGHPVAAVGDPHQSIYGWRGASAGNLRRFPVDFPGPDGVTAGTRYLSTSWRNDAAVLAVANRLSADLRLATPGARSGADPDPGSGDGSDPGSGGGSSPGPGADLGAVVDVPGLVARPGAGPGQLRLAWLATVEDEARAVAELIEQHWRSTSPPPSAAVLCRARAQFPLVEAALRARGLPVEVVGLGGLLSQPEVADLRAALEVLHDPTRGDSLMRLLTGPAWRIGPRDLEALGLWAAALVRGDRRPADRRPAPAEADVVDERSLVDALDALPPDGWQGPVGQQLSAAGRNRLARLGSVLRDLRGRIGLPLPDLVLEVERALLLDVEVAARPGTRPAAARAHLDAFVDVAAGFTSSGERAGLAAFLGWLAAADNREHGLETPISQVRPDAVQVLTVHAAKGLEWDVVAVTGLVEGTFPTGRNGRPTEVSNGWLGELGALPYPLRGDADELPHWELAQASTQPELAATLEDFRHRCRRHEVAEERRLAYVAVTRARRTLLLTGAVWGSGSTPRQPSRFLREAAELPDAVTTSWAEPPAEDTANPRDALSPTVPWPRDVLAARRPQVQAGADLVLAALATSAPPPDQPLDGQPVGDGQPWAREVRLLLAERDVASRRRVQVPLPVHLSASRLVALAADPAALALRLRRPMPEPPSPHARRGSAFHAWLERRFGAAALVEEDELPGAADDTVTERELAVLQRRFLASEWAQRTPEAVEVSIETPVAGVVLRGRIDAVFRDAAPSSTRPGAESAGPGAESAGPRWDVVDWKTGAPPSADRRGPAAVQLAVYRLAWARLQGVDVSRVGAAFFYAATGTTVRPVDLLDADGLLALITASVSADS